MSHGLVLIDSCAWIDDLCDQEVKPGYKIVVLIENYQKVENDQEAITGEFISKLPPSLVTEKQQQQINFIADSAKSVPSQKSGWLNAVYDCKTWKPGNYYAFDGFICYFQTISIN